ncbi:MAG: hypothetical protein HC875_33930 [Anaerolineales bacterium]|nr:hypothetical protein [Anaerolineales bacterium]
MPTISIDNDWVETAQLFGEVEQVVKDALRTYSIEQCIQHIEQATTKIKRYSQQYDCDYDFFKQAVQTDETFLAKVEAQNPLWEEDAMEWEYWLEERQAWTQRLETILQR